jgi:lipopolysaccharide/colanic/teichoic acid biosynthesis glycosyltransferase
MGSTTDDASPRRLPQLWPRAHDSAQIEGLRINPSHTGESPQQAIAAGSRMSGRARLAPVLRTEAAAEPWVTAPPKSLGYHAVKRAVDIVVGVFGLAVGLPIMFILAVIIRLDSPGPIVFRQYRLGEHGRPFRFYKFRTMWVDARERFPELYAYAYTDAEIREMYFKVLDDPRLTRFGAHLRKTSLDELPNLINVLLGDMTLVGPRPELPEMLPYYTPHQLMKFSVKPGATGLAQVTGRAVLRFQQTIASDLEYCAKRSLWFDFMILVRTTKTIIQRVGAF